jgi:hypothetical protein
VLLLSIIQNLEQAGCEVFKAAILSIQSFQQAEPVDKVQMATEALYFPGIEFKTRKDILIIR